MDLAAFQSKKRADQIKAIIKKATKSDNKQYQKMGRDGKIVHTTNVKVTQTTTGSGEDAVTKDELYLDDSITGRLFLEKSGAYLPGRKYVMIILVATFWGGF